MSFFRLSAFKPCYGLLCAVLLLACLGGCKRKPAGPVFDVPSLLGKNIDEVTTALRGATVTEGSLNPQQAPGEGLAQRNFRRKDHTLQVTYKTNNKKVTAYQIDVDAKTGSIKEADKDEFLLTGNLKPNDSRYSLEFAEDAEKVFTFTGVRVVPNPVQRKVTFRVTGTEFICSIVYAVRSNGSDIKSEKLLTAPKWETSVDVSVTATEDTDLVFQVMPYTGEPYSLDRMPLPAGFKINCQILVDNKVVSEAESTGFAATCAWQL